MAKKRNRTQRLRWALMFQQAVTILLMFTYIVSSINIRSSPPGGAEEKATSASGGLLRQARKAASYVTGERGLFSGKEKKTTGMFTEGEESPEDVRSVMSVKGGAEEKATSASGGTEGKATSVLKKDEPSPLQIPRLGMGSFLLKSDLIDGIPGIVSAACDADIRLFDMASLYGHPQTIFAAEIIACATKKYPQEIFVIAKGDLEGRPPIPEYLRILHDSKAQNLRFVVVNHRTGLQWDPTFAATQLKDDWGFGEDERLFGYGVSNCYQRCLENILTQCNEKGYDLPMVNEIEIGPMSMQGSFVDYMKAKGILPIAYSATRVFQHSRGDENPYAVAAANINDEREKKEPGAEEGSTRKFDIRSVVQAYLVFRDVAVIPWSTNVERVKHQNSADVRDILEHFRDELQSIDATIKNPENAEEIWHIDNALPMIDTAADAYYSQTF